MFVCDCSCPRALSYKEHAMTAGILYTINEPKACGIVQPARIRRTSLHVPLSALATYPLFCDALHLYACFLAELHLQGFSMVKVAIEARLAPKRPVSLVIGKSSAGVTSCSSG